MKHDFQIGEVIAPIGRDVKYVVIDTFSGAYSMYNVKVGYIVPLSPMLETDKNYVKVGKWDFEREVEVEDDE